MIAKEHAKARLVIRLLGKWEVTVDGRPATAFKYDKVRALLAFLVMETDAAHGREQLAGLLWPDSLESAARDGLRQALATLRRAIGDKEARPPHLLSSRETLAFNLESSCEVDALRFLEAVNACRRHGHRKLAGCPACLERLALAAELYGGDFLEHFSIADAPPFEQWLTVQREHLRRLALETLDTLAAHALRRGDWGAAQCHAQRQLALEPWREASHRRLMRALAYDGKRLEALAQFETCRASLAGELRVEPESDTLALYEQIRLGAIRAPLRTVPSLAGTAGYGERDLVGRKRELAKLLALMSTRDARLITISGPGGVGKTHLAAVVAERAQPYFNDGAAFVPLASLEHVQQIPAAIATAMGLRFEGPQDLRTQLLERLAEREMLLVLDNFEHLAGEPTLLADLVNRAAALVLLVTSRHRLRLRQEQLFPLQGLAFPADVDETSDDQKASAGGSLETYDAVRLFVGQVRRLRPAFELDPAQHQPVVELCRLADGMPMALQLAAAMSAETNPGKVATQLAADTLVAVDGFYDAPDRQRSLTATLAYAWRLLNDAEQSVFSCLAIFRGSFDLAAVQAVIGANAGQLQKLVDKSLLQENGSGPSRRDRGQSGIQAEVGGMTYALHPLARRYARGKLLEAPTMAAGVAERHATYFLGQVEIEGREAGTVTLDGEALDGAARLGLALNDIRQAWRWAVEHAQRDLLRTAVGGLAAFLTFAGLYQEAEETFGAAARALQEDPALVADLLLAQAGARQKLGDYEGGLELVARAMALLDGSAAVADKEKSFRLARAHILQGHLLELVGSYDGALDQLERALDILREEHGVPERAVALDRIGSIQWRSSRYQEALEMFQLAMDLDEAAGRRGRLARHLGNLGLVYKDMGDFERALDHLRRALATAESQGHREDTARYSLNVGLVYWQMGRLDEAHDHYQRALALARTLQHRRGTATSLANLGVVERLRGHYAAALGYYGEALELAQMLGEKALQAHVLGNTGNVYMDTGHYEQAMEYLQEALALDRALGNEDGVARHLGNLGDLHKVMGQGVRAATYFDEAIHLLRKSGNKYYLCWVMVARAEAELSLAQDESNRARALAKAQAMNDEGGALAEEIGRREYSFASRVLRGRLLATGGDRVAALAYLGELLEEAAGPEEKAEVNFARWEIGGGEDARRQATTHYRALANKATKAIYERRLAVLQGNSRKR